jgi:hypothetical protein
VTAAAIGIGNVTDAIDGNRTVDRTVLVMAAAVGMGGASLPSHSTMHGIGGTTTRIYTTIVTDASGTDVVISAIGTWLRMVCEALPHCTSCVLNNNSYYFGRCETCAVIWLQTK